MPATSRLHGAEVARQVRIVAVMGVALLSAAASLGLWPATAAAPPQTHVVLMEGMKFVPATLRIRPGDQVAFRNNDLVPHTATSKGPGAFDSGVIRPGESWAVRPAAPAVRYVCLYHPTMQGEIIVE